jgi:hypothetical protein
MGAPSAALRDAPGRPPEGEAYRMRLEDRLLLNALEPPPERRRSPWLTLVLLLAACAALGVARGLMVR